MLVIQNAFFITLFFCVILM